MREGDEIASIARVDHEEEELETPIDGVEPSDEGNSDTSAEEKE